MESIDVGVLRARVRRSYELSRVYLGMRSAWWAIPPVAFSFLTAHSARTSTVLGVGLVLAIVVLRWLGNAFGRAIAPSLLAGSAPLVLPLLLRGSEHTCLGGACWSACMLGCIVGGLAAGATIGWLSAREREHRWSFLAAATFLTVLTGSLGCAVVGAAGTIGMLLAVIVSSLPVYLVVQRA